MISLLAQAQLPVEYKGITVVVVGSIVTLILVSGVILIGLQRARAALAKEIRLELESATKRMKVEVQTPMEIKAHAEFTPIGMHRELAVIVTRMGDSVDARFAEQARASSAGREKIYGELRDQGKQAAATEEKVDLVNAQVQRLDGKIDRILENQNRRH